MPEAKKKKLTMKRPGEADSHVARKRKWGEDEEKISKNESRSMVSSLKRLIWSEDKPTKNKLDKNGNDECYRSPQFDVDCSNNKDQDTNSCVTFPSSFVKRGITVSRECNDFNGDSDSDSLSDCYK